MAVAFVLGTIGVVLVGGALLLLAGRLLLSLLPPILPFP